MENTDLAKRQKAITNIREQLRLFQRAFEQAQQTVSDDLKILGITWPDLAVIDIKQHILDEKSAEISKKQEQLKSEAEKIAEELKESVASQQSFTAKLNAPQQQFEAYQQQLSEWNKSWLI